MARRISDKTKIERQMGKGSGKNYKPFITTSEFNSIGTTAVIRDWKTGRGVHCLSQGEVYWYYILRWDDNNVDIKEQYPLDLPDTLKIAEENGFKHPANKNHIMTTDFLVTEADGSLHAYSVKSDRNSLSERTLELLCIEKQYWLLKGAKFTLLFKEDANTILVNNIRRSVEFYDKSSVFDEFSMILHKLARKVVICDMNTEILNKNNIYSGKEKQNEGEHD